MTHGRRRFDTVTSRTILVGVITAVVTAVVAGVIAVPLIRAAAQDQARSALSTLADTTAATVENPDPGSIGRLQQLLAEQDTEALLLLPGEPVPPQVPDEIAAALLTGQPVSEAYVTAEGTFFLEGRPVGQGAGVLLVTSDDRAQQARQRTERRLGLALLGGAGVAVVVAIAASRRVTRPLREAASAAERLASGDRDVRVEPSGPDEVVELAEQMNRLTRALTVSEGRQRDFLLSVSHELRTPLTAIAGYAEALADGVVPARGGAADRRDPAARGGTADAARGRPAGPGAAGRGGPAHRRRPTDLAALVGDACTVWRDRCRPLGVSRRCELPDGPLVATTDALRVRQIIDNLAENALRVTPDGGTIVFALRREGSAAVLQVRDTGPGLAPEDLDVAFEPAVLFTRYQGVRPVGSGVGLALVGRLAARLGGRATAGHAEGAGACFTVRLPLEGAGPTAPAPVAGGIAAPPAAGPSAAQG